MTSDNYNFYYDDLIIECLDRNLIKPIIHIY